MIREWRPIWEDKEIDYLRDKYQTISCSEIGNFLGRSQHSVHHKLSRLGLEKGNLQYKLSEENKKLTKELAYFLGATLGDGSVACRDRNYTRILFGVNDKDFALFYKKCFENQFKTNALYYSRRKKHIIQIGFLEICKFVKYYDYSQILKSNDEIKGWFLRGLYDAEGHVGLSKAKTIKVIGFTNTNKNIIKYVSKILNNFGIKYYISNRKSKNNYKKRFDIVFWGKENIIKFREKINFTIKRKSERLKLLPKEHNNKKWREGISKKAKLRKRDEFGKWKAGRIVTERDA